VIEFDTDEMTEMPYTGVDPDVHRVVTFTLDSNMLTVLNVDTYQTFNGDSWLEYEIEGLVENYPALDGLEYDDLSIEWHWGDIIRGLGEVNVEALQSALPEIFIEIPDVGATWSPKAYNFATDSFRARYTVDWTAFEEAFTEKFGMGILSEEFEDVVRERWRSYDGFHSHVPHNLDTDREATLNWAALNHYLENWVGCWHYENLRDQILMATAEAEHEVFSEHVEVSLREDAYDRFMLRRLEALGLVPEGTEDPEEWLADTLAERGVTISYHELYPWEPDKAALDFAGLLPLDGQTEVEL
jgi:hypothetical protein